MVGQKNVYGCLCVIQNIQCHIGFLANNLQALMLFFQASIYASIYGIIVLKKCNSFCYS